MGGTPSSREVIAILLARLGGEVEITDEELERAEYADVQIHMAEDFIRNAVRLRVRMEIPGEVIASEIVEETRPAISPAAAPE